MSKVKQAEWMREHRRKLKKGVIPNAIHGTVADKMRAAGLTLEGNKIVSAAKPVAPLANPGIPLYDPTKHKPGDRVLVKPAHGKRMVETVIPALDLDGNPMP